MKQSLFIQLQDANWIIFRDMVLYKKNDNEIEVKDMNPIKGWRFILSGDKKFNGSFIPGYRGILLVDDDEYITKQYSKITQITRHVKRFAI